MVVYNVADSASREMQEEALLDGSLDRSVVDFPSELSQHLYNAMFSCSAKRHPRDTVVMTST